LHIATDSKKERLITLTKPFIVLVFSEIGIVCYNSECGKKGCMWYYGCTVFYNDEQISCLPALFICSLFNDTVSNSDYIAMNDWIVANNELKMMYKETVMVQFKIVSWYLLQESQKL
jgi:hypothetical protein